MPNYLLCHLPKSEQKNWPFFPSLLCPSRKDNSFCFFQFLYLLDNEKTRLYFLWNITTLVKKNMFELVVKHVWTCLNMLLLNILFTELVTNDVSPCRYYEKKSLHQFFFNYFQFKNKVQIQVSFFTFGNKKPIELEYKIPPIFHRALSSEKSKSFPQTPSQ